MAGYIGSKSSVTLVDGYTEAEADAEFVNDPSSVITVSGSNVGIGETVPLGRLHVKTADSGATVDVGADEFVIEGSGNAGMSILSGASNTGSIYFGDSGTNWDGYIAYSQNSRSMTFGTAAGGGSMTLDSSGRVTAPSQPAFLVRPSGYQLNIQNLATTLVAFGNETFDRGNNFSNSIYTAPVTGVYQFNFGLRIQSVDTAATYYQTTLNTSNSYFEHLFSPKLTSDMQYWTVQVSVLADMDAGDTAKVEILQAFGDGAMDIHSASHFSGYLVA